MRVDAATIRRAMRLSTSDGIFAVQYTTLTGGTLLTTFLLALGAGEAQIGLVAALPLLAGLLQPFGAELIRRRGGWRRGVIVSSALAELGLWVASLTAVVVLPPQRALVVVIGVLALQQAASAFVSVGWTSWMSDLIPPGLRGRYFGHRNFVCNALGALTAVVVGQVVRQGTPEQLDVYVGVILVGMAFRGVSVAMLARQPEPVPAHSLAGGVLRQLAEPFAHRGFRSFLLYGMAWGFAMQIAAPFFTVYMVRELEVGVATVMLLAGLGTVANLVGQRVWGRLCDAYGDRQVMQMAGLTVVLQPLWWMLTAGSGPGYYLMLLLSVTGGFAGGGLLLATGNLMMRLAPEIGRTAFFAAQGALGGLCGALGPLVGGAVAVALPPGFRPVDSWLFEGLKTLFFVSFVLRLGAWVLLRRVPEPVARPRLRAVYLLRDVVRTFNPTQGFSVLLQVFTVDGAEEERNVSTGSGSATRRSPRR